MTDELIETFEKKIKTLDLIEEKMNALCNLAENRITSDIATIKQSNEKLNSLNAKLRIKNPLDNYHKDTVLMSDKIKLTQVKSHEDILQIKPDDLEKTRIN